MLLHGNLSTGRFFAHIEAPDRYRLIAPDMRGFGDSERKPMDATRGLHDWADDTYALVTHARHRPSGAHRRLVDRRRRRRAVTRSITRSPRSP